MPVIVTNKHVIANSRVGTFVLTKCDPQGEPIIGATERVTLEGFESRWFKHPDPNIDLAVYPIAQLHRDAQERGIQFYAPSIPETLIPSEEQLGNLSGIENITMIGYPNGIWDQKNNLPIVRRGITATSPKFYYNGLPLFVIDCACFPGSSGSPVLVFDQGGYMDGKGGLVLGGSRILLLGVLFAGPQHVAEGEIQTIEVPLAKVPISLSKIPNNLGFVVKSRKLLDFRQFFVPIG